MKTNKLKQIIREEILNEGMTRQDFKMMAREIRKASPQHQPILTAFAIIIGKNQNPNFDDARFKEAIKSGKGI